MLFSNFQSGPWTKNVKVSFCAVRTELEPENGQPYFQDTLGSINDRYSYEHHPLGDKYRNYAEIAINFEPSTQVFVNLQRVPTSMFKITDDLSDDEE